ncbi:MAG: M48 family metallopeptidase [Leptolyngbyaceae cyanobacterium bins.349]|nr:M48 family metallopeptidase [Leptolyngbyaceae cyanobacterium bins.349]
MLSKLFLSSLSRFRRWMYPAIALMTVVSLVFGQPLISQALPWRDLILRGIQVIQLSSLSPQQEVEIGRQINDQLVAQRIRLLQNPEVNQYVNQIGQRLVAQNNRANIPYTFQVVNDRGVNAFATMGGFVYVNRGLLQLADNEAELASVMAHEIGHIVGRHAVEQMRKTAIASGLVGAAGLDRNVAANIGVELAFRRPNSRRDELEADSLGLEMLRRAGYAPVAMVSFMEKLLQNGGSVPTVLSTHPATDERIARLRQSLNSSANLGDGLDRANYRARLRSLS